MKWRAKSGGFISCVEKIKILDQNLEELLSLNLSFQEIEHSVEFKEAMEDCILLDACRQDLIDYLKKANPHHSSTQKEF